MVKYLLVIFLLVLVVNVAMFTKITYNTYAYSQRIIKQPDVVKTIPEEIKIINTEELPWEDQPAIPLNN